MRVALLLTVAAAPALAGSGEHWFQTPSGNIFCVLQEYEEPQNVRCDLREATISYKQRPEGCELDFGQSFYLEARGGAELACVGDTIINPTVRKLGYGEVLDVGGIRCRSERSGLSCENSAGRGFTLSRARQKLF